MADESSEAAGDPKRRFTRRIALGEWQAQPAVQIGLAAAFFLALTLVVLGPVLFAGGDLVLSNGETDLAKQFVHWRAFGFGELRAGHLALWNPHIFSGTPFFGGFQSALLYPPNWLYLCLPLAWAINVGIAIHVFLAGFFMHLWVRRRGLHPLACLLAGVLFMFSGPYFLHIYAGHLSNLCTMVWGPLIFLAIDGWLERRTPGWVWLGAGAVALQILAGHPQYVFYTGVAGGLYCLGHLVIVERRMQALAGLVAIVGGAVGLSAVQLFEGIHVAGETVRNHGISPDFAAVFSFPPENLLTALVPGFFGDMTRCTYWGRFNLWEMSLFFGVTGLVLAVYGAVYGEKRTRHFCGGLAIFLLLISLGANTPLFGVLYRYAPGFGKFRGWSKFVYPATLFLVVLAATGFDAMLRGVHLPRRGTALVVISGSIVAGCIAFWIGGANGATHLHDLVHWLFATGDVYQDQKFMEDSEFIAQAARFASRQWLVAAGTLFAIGSLFALARRYPTSLRGLLVVAVIEMVVFAHSTLDTFPLADALTPPPILPVGDARWLNQESPNLAISIGTSDLWGYDPGVLRRYAEWMAVTQGLEAADASETVHFWNYPHSLSSLLRCRFIYYPTAADGTYGPPFSPRDAPAERLSLISDVRVIANRDEIFKAMQAPDFDPERTVILQTSPIPLPIPRGQPGSVRLVHETSDALTVEADLSQAEVLLVTDTYCTGWQARPLLPKSAQIQRNYRVLPADYFLRAIPLQAGHHRFLLEYRPVAFVVGKWVSLASLLAYAAAGGWLVWRHRRTKRPTGQPIRAAA